MKIIRNIFIVIFSLIAFIFLTLLLTPLLFKGKIFEIAKTQLNNMLTAHVDFSDLKLSFIRNFPSAYIALEDVSVTGTGDFDGETLVAFKTLSVTVDIMSVIKMENMQVKSVILDQVEANAHILETGKANWDIMKPSEAAEVPPPADTPPDKADPNKDGEVPASSTLNIALNKFEIRNANLSFTDDKSNMKAAVDDLNFFLRGDTTLDDANIDLKLGIAAVNFWMGGVHLVNNAQIGLTADAAADIKNMGIALKEARFNINEIVLKLAGLVGMPPNGDINLDVAFATEKTDFKDVLSLVPAIYMTGFESITTTGSFNIAGDVKGTLNGKQMPCANVSLNVDNAMFKYPDLPKSVNNINIAVKAYYDGVKFDNTTADLNKLHFEMAGNPFDAEAHVKTPESDLQVAAKFAGKIDFDSLADIVPLDDITVKGLLECDLALAGRMSTIEKEQYEDFDLRGMVKLTGVRATMAALPQPVQINRTQLDFTPRVVNLANFDAIIGKSDISLSGGLENFIPFALKGATVRGNLNLKSNNIDLNEFMGGDKPDEEKKVEEKPENTEPMSVIEVPKNIDFALNVNIGKLLFDKLSITNTVGNVLVRDGKVQMQKLGMNLLQGSLTLNGEYNTQDVKAPAIDFGMDIKRFDVESAISSFKILETILPQPQNYAGQVSANLTLNSVLDEHMSPVLDSVASRGQLQTHNLQLRNSEIFGKMADLLKNETWRTPTLNNTDVKFEIKDGRVNVEPINMNIAQTRLVLSGSQGLDSTMDYKLNASVPMAAVGKGATDVLGKIPGGASVKEITVTGLVGGTATKPEVSLSVADMASNVAKAVVGAVTEKVTERVSEEVAKQKAAVMAEAEKQAANIRATAKQTADRIRTEANNAANQTEQKATNPLQKAAAKVAADKLRSEGEANAVKTEQEAERQINNIMDAARKKADAIK